jgi:hypothetical protein
MAFSRIPPTINTKGKGRSNIIETATPTQNQYSRPLKGTHETPFTTSSNSDSEHWENPTEPPILQSNAMPSQSNENLLRGMIQTMQMQIQMQAQAQTRAEIQAQAQAEALAEARAQIQAIQIQLQAQLQFQQPTQPTASGNTHKQIRIYRRILQLQK